MDVKITKLPPGEAEGARDLQHWSSRRVGGRSGLGIDKAKRLLVACQACKHTVRIKAPGRPQPWRFRCSGCGSGEVKFFTIADE